MNDKFCDVVIVEKYSSSPSQPRWCVHSVVPTSALGAQIGGRYCPGILCRVPEPPSPSPWLAGGIMLSLIAAAAVGDVAIELPIGMMMAPVMDAQSQFAGLAEMMSQLHEMSAQPVQRMPTNPCAQVCAAATPAAVTCLFFFPVAGPTRTQPRGGGGDAVRAAVPPLRSSDSSPPVPLPP